MSRFIYNGRSSDDFNILVSGGGTFASPEADVERVEVPGRNGELLISNGRYRNVEITYEGAISRRFSERFDAFRSFLLSEPGYHRLEDTYHPGEYRMASFLSSLNPEMVGSFCRAGIFDITFLCKPQRFLRSGEVSLSIQAPQFAIYNPAMESMPLITVYGSGTGTVTVGGVTVDIKSLDEYVVLDCDTQNAYKGLQNKNSTISASQFPTIPPGESLVTWTGGVERVDIIPRWWTL